MNVHMDFLSGDTMEVKLQHWDLYVMDTEVQILGARPETDPIAL